MKTISFVAFLAAGALVACGGSKKSAEEPAPAAAEPAAPGDPATAEPATAAPAGGDATCAQLIDHYIEVMLASEEYKNAKPEEKKMVDDMLPQIKEQGTAQCEQESLSAEEKACVMAAQTMAELEACDKE